MDKSRERDFPVRTSLTTRERMSTDIENQCLRSLKNCGPNPRIQVRVCYTYIPRNRVASVKLYLLSYKCCFHATRFHTVFSFAHRL